MGFATNAIHVGQEPEPATGAVVAPIYQTSTYVYAELGKTRSGYDYARTNHPNRKGLHISNGTSILIERKCRR